jgi:DNA-binding NarL/FixJ family response regulator
MNQPPIRLLVVDDFAETRENIRKLLQFESDIVVVGTAANGVEAIQLHDALRPDVVIMCINMPLMDGITATKAIVSKHPDAKILILSVQSGPEYIKHAMQAGAEAYIVKPPRAGELVETVRHLAGRPAHPPAGPLRVLIAEDIACTGASLRALLDSDPAFLVVGEAKDGARAIEEYQRLRPDVVSMRVNMPEMDGITATAKIVSSDAQAAVVVVSAEPSREEVRKAMAAGAIDYVRLPSDPSIYLSSIKNAASRRGRRAPIAPGRVPPSIVRYWHEEDRPRVDGPRRQSLAGRFGEPQDAATPRLSYPERPHAALSSGRSVFIDHLVIRSNYYGILVGNPYDVSRGIWLTLPLSVDELMGCRVHPVYVVEELSPVLPSYLCVAELSSTPMDPRFDFSKLYVCWFTNVIDLPISAMLKSVLDHIPWEEKAQDMEW